MFIISTDRGAKDSDRVSMGNISFINIVDKNNGRGKRKILSSRSFLYAITMFSVTSLKRPVIVEREGSDIWRLQFHLSSLSNALL